MNFLTFVCSKGVCLTLWKRTYLARSTEDTHVQIYINNDFYQLITQLRARDFINSNLLFFNIQKDQKFDDDGIKTDKEVIKGWKIHLHLIVVKWSLFEEIDR